MKYKFWVYDLNTDGVYANSAPELLSHIDDLLQSGIALRDIGVNRCDNWLLTCTLLGAKIEVKYPHWKTQALKVETKPPCLPEHLEDSWVRRSVDGGVPTLAGCTCG
jgi:hypothetical protein